MSITNFNIRVYGIVINAKQELLISHESYQNTALTKFVGGGLEKGEGLKTALIREFMEELNEDVEVGELFFVNDFFQQSAFIATDQIISLFYLVRPKDVQSFTAKTVVRSDKQWFEWLALSDIGNDLFTFEIERLVLAKLKAAFSA